MITGPEPQPEQSLKIKGKTVVFIDWANVYNWKDKLGWEVDPKKVFDYLRTYKQIKQIRFYFGTDTHPASKEQIKQAKKIGYHVVTKPVKYLPVRDKGITIWKRKCDFDLEIGLDCFETVGISSGFIFLTGDGDMATLYKRLVQRKKQIIVIYARGTLGREVAEINENIYKFDVIRIKNLVKKMTLSRRPRA